MSLLLLAAAILGGTAATYLYEDDEPLGVRLATGVPIGIIVLGHAGFLFSSVLGLGGPAIAAAALVVLLPVTALGAAGRQPLVRADLAALREAATRRPTRAGIATAFFFVALGASFWRVCDRTMFEEGGAIFTGVDHNLGDLPFHLSIVTSFLHGQNFPPEHPELTGTRLTYPFLVDLVAAMLMRAGAGLRGALFAENLALAWALGVLLHRFCLRLTAHPTAALVAAIVVLLSGGLGFALLKQGVDAAGDGLVGWLRQPGHDLTIVGSGPYRWGNIVITMLMPQRSFLLGMPAFLVVATLWWRAVGERAGDDPAAADRARRRLLAAGVLTGLLPLAHAHAFATALAVGAALCVLFPTTAWKGFFAAAVALSLPQALFAATGTAMRARGFLAWEVGWDHGTVPALSFWLLNLGPFLPLLLLALAWRGPRPVVPARLLRFYAPFLFCFVVPNLLRLSPWIWDNIKFLVWWHVASAPLVALVLVRLWEGRPGVRVAAALLFVLLTAAGAHDVYRVVAGTIRITVFAPEAVAFARTLMETTPPRALVLHAPTFNSEVYLAGRRTLLGYAGHIWSQGLEPGAREDHVRRMYAGGPEVPELLRRYGVDYILVGPRERADLAVNEEALSILPVIVEGPAYRLYRAR